MPTPADKILYEKIKQIIHKKYKPSAYRSGLLVKMYKNSFKEIHGDNKNPYIGTKKNTGLTRWFKEDWKSDTGKYGYTSKSSVYRPTKRITPQTPATFSELTKKEIQSAKKQKYKYGRVKKFKRK